jgi:uncharacterized MAPEG superfamily protein
MILYVCLTKYSLALSFSHQQSNALALVELFSASPLKLNHLLSIALIWLLAYLPHGLRVKVVTELECAKGRELEIANGRALTERMSAQNKYVGVLTGAHINGLEAFSAYSATIAMMMFAGVDESALRGYAACYVVLRIAYTCVYLSPWNGLLRVVVYSVGMYCIWSMMITTSTLYDMKKA